VRCLAWVLLALGSAGCALTHSTRNAPGNVDLARRTEDPEQPPTSPPEDPGEDALRLAVGPSGAGVIPSQSSDGKTRGAFGAEFSAYLHRRKYSVPWDRRDGFYGSADRYNGINVGVLGLWREDRSGARFYAEAQHSELAGLVGLAAGWQATTLGHHGPQLTLSLGPLYVRSATSLEQGTDFELGAIFKYPWTVWLGSR